VPSVVHFAQCTHFPTSVGERGAARAHRFSSLERPPDSRFALSKKCMSCSQKVGTPLVSGICSIVGINYLHKAAASRLWDIGHGAATPGQCNRAGVTAPGRGGRGASGCPRVAQRHTAAAAVAPLAVARQPAHRLRASCLDSRCVPQPPR
jgi:hypothetical protein